MSIRVPNREGNLNVASPVLSVVIPCYNEEEVLPVTAERLTSMLSQMKAEGLISENSFLLFVDDGSKDKTWQIIGSLAREQPMIHGIKLAHNAGHQNALFAGLMEAKKQADCVISIDADLQDDVDVMREFMQKYKQGFEIVYGVRKSRASDTFFKRTTAEGFYRFMRAMGVQIVFNHADYRLLSRRALEYLEEYRERNLFLRGIIPLLGLKSATVYYDRHERYAGQSKYPLRKMLAFAFEGITSFSVTPIRFVTLMGFSIFIISIAAGLYALWSKLAGRSIGGWTSLMLSIWFIGGINLMSIGLIGEYIGKIYLETKQRPRYLIEERLAPLPQRDTSYDKMGSRS
ncbi:glycosyltransferase family 2 protein [Thermicanus aegyptius]|uniref:glycosyltransferase family 2 protein n=1 Tax=Thermicanus aegyptius TaxID=94009 RepID=UPI00042133E1|nr:glycosyltransferase family 2 protein [Thermicanus aegyptius]